MEDSPFRKQASLSDTSQRISRRCHFCSVFFNIRGKKRKNIYIYLCIYIFVPCSIYFKSTYFLFLHPRLAGLLLALLAGPNTPRFSDAHTPKHTLRRSRCSAGQAEQTLIQMTPFSLTRTVYIFLMGRFQVIY